VKSLCSGVSTNYDWLLPGLQPSECVKAIMHAVLTDRPFVAIPRTMYLMYNNATWMPMRLQAALCKFIGVNEAMKKFLPTRSYQLKASESWTNEWNWRLWGAGHKCSPLRVSVAKENACANILCPCCVFAVTPRFEPTSFTSEETKYFNRAKQYSAIRKISSRERLLVEFVSGWNGTAKLCAAA